MQPHRMVQIAGAVMIMVNMAWQMMSATHNVVEVLVMMLIYVGEIWRMMSIAYSLQTQQHVSRDICDRTIQNAICAYVVRFVRCLYIAHFKPP